MAELFTIKEFLDKFCSDCRVYHFEGAWYVFRDRLVGDGKTQCQYGVLDKTRNDGAISWWDCPEGSLFSSVQPFVASHFVKIGVDDRRRSLDTSNVIT
jgi:hypothetical protein